MKAPGMLLLTAFGVLALREAFKSRPPTRREPPESIRERFRTPHRGGTTPPELSAKQRLHSLAGIVPEARAPFDELLAQAKAWQMSPYISSALRTCKEQGALKGQSAVSSCKSWHTLGRAVDLELRNEDGSPGDRGTYELLGEWWEAHGGIWGGRWLKSYPEGLAGFPEAGPGDPVHFQWTGKAIGVPAALCPSGLNLDECQRAADHYLTYQWSRGAQGLS